MAPMINMNWIFKAFDMQDTLFYGSEATKDRFSDYVNFSIENFKLAIEMEGGSFPQIRLKSDLSLSCNTT